MWGSVWFNYIGHGQERKTMVNALPLLRLLSSLIYATGRRRSCSISHHFLLGFRPISSTVNSKMSTENYQFGPYKIDAKEVFYSSPLSYAMVNLRPVVPDVLVCPRREVKRFVNLTSDEACDLWLTAQKIGCKLECFNKATSLTFTIQDGPQAGQTVAHVHIHILPRKAGDFEKNDEIYDAIDEKEKELTQKLDLDKERTDRSMEEMADEAAQYRSFFL